MPRRQEEPKPMQKAGRALAGRLEPLLLAGPMGMREITTTLEVDPEVVVVALRKLRRRDDGRLRSGISLGHVCWWWEPATRPGRDGAALPAESAGSAAKTEDAPAAERAKKRKKRKKGSRRLATGRASAARKARGVHPERSRGAGHDPGEQPGIEEAVPVASAGQGIA
jgi:hypothetical protein